MTFTTFTSFPDTTTNANFKAWIQGTSNALTATGNPKTADAGQFDPATFTAVGVSGAYPAYEIRRFNDSLQSAAPVFYKMEFGSFASVARPAIRLTVGTTTDGAGTIGGNATTALAVPGNTPSSTLTANSLFSGDSNRVVAAMFGDGQTLGCGIHFAIERTKDSLGNDTTEGALVTMMSSHTSQKISQFLPFIGGVPSVDVLGSIGAINGNGTDGADVITCPNFPFRGSGLMNPGLNVEFYMNGSVNPGTIAPIERYGISRNYYFIGNNTSFTGTLRGSAAWIANSTLAIRWE